MAAGRTGAEDYLNGTASRCKGKTDREDNDPYPLGVLNKALVTELAELTKERPGTTELYFKVTDPESKMTLDLVSRPVKLSVGRELISYLKERPELDFRIN